MMDPRFRGDDDAIYTQHPQYQNLQYRSTLLI